MSTPRTRARRMRGVLVGACSTAATVAAHTAAAGAVPHGMTLFAAVTVCAAVGVLVGLVDVSGRFLRPITTVAALSVAQLLGHVALAATGSHHHHGAQAVSSSSMLAAHLCAALLLGTAIACVEHLYVVGTSLLGWLRLFTIPVTRPRARALRIWVYDVVAQSVSYCSGLTTRGPPTHVAV